MVTERGRKYVRKAAEVEVEVEVQMGGRCKCVNINPPKLVVDPVQHENVGRSRGGR